MATPTPNTDSHTAPNVASTLPPAALIIRRKQLTRDEQAVLLAMLEIGDSTGSRLYIRVPRIAAHSCLSERTVQRVLWGTKSDKRRERPGLVHRGILQELAPSNTTKRKAATYCLHVDVLNDDPRKCRYYDQVPLPFQPTLEELRQWIRQHLKQWELTNQSIRDYASKHAHELDFSTAAAVAFAIGQARKHGMPYPLAKLAFAGSHA